MYADTGTCSTDIVLVADSNTKPALLKPNSGFGTSGHNIRYTSNHTAMPKSDLPDTKSVRGLPNTRASVSSRARPCRCRSTTYEREEITQRNKVHVTNRSHISSVGHLWLKCRPPQQEVQHSYRVTGLLPCWQCSARPNTAVPRHQQLIAECLVFRACGTHTTRRRVSTHHRRLGPLSCRGFSSYGVGRSRGSR